MTLAGWLQTQARNLWDWLRGKGRDKPHGKPKPEPEPEPSRVFHFPWWLPALCLLAWACRLPTEGLAPIQPEWLMGWQEAEACSGRTGDVTRIRWHVVPESSAIMEHGHLIGYTEGRDIYLSRPWASQRWLARHESLHALGIHHHPPAIFVTRCHATWGAIRDTLDAGVLGKGVG